MMGLDAHQLVKIVKTGIFVSNLIVFVSPTALILNCIIRNFCSHDGYYVYF
jgi:hypothetical protein